MEPDGPRVKDITRRSAETGPKVAVQVLGEERPAALSGRNLAQQGGQERHPPRSRR